MLSIFLQFDCSLIFVIRISVICEKVGYTDAKNFSTAYKKHFGYPLSAQSYELDDQV